MRRLKFILSSILVVFALSSMAQVETLKASADQTYITADYQKAIGEYEQILAQEYVSAEVHYNLGNAYFKSGQLAPAVLNYERALKLAPKDEDIQFNLRLVNLSVKDKVEVMPQLFFINWWHAVLKAFSTDGWAWSAVLAIALGLLGLLLFKFSNDEGIRRLTFYAALIALLWGGFSIYAAQQRYDHAVNDRRAVVFASTITAKSAPDQKGKDLFVIHEGLVVTVTTEMNGWASIRLSNGNVGWIPETALSPI